MEINLSVTIYKMENNFSLEDIMLKVLPWWFFLAICFCMSSVSTQITLNESLDFLYTFLFFCSAFICWELLQTISHIKLFELFTKAFFKFRLPSQIFLYKNNPIISEWIRNDLLKKIKLKKDEIRLFNKEYKDVCLCPCSSKIENSFSQEIFRKLYSKVENDDKIKASNRSYLFLRVFFLEFLILAFLFFFYRKMREIWVFNLIIACIILWRVRGVAKRFVFKIVLFNIKD